MSEAVASVVTGGMSDRLAMAVVLPAPTGPANRILLSLGRMQSPYRFLIRPSRRDSRLCLAGGRGAGAGVDARVADGAASLVLPTCSSRPSACLAAMKLHSVAGSIFSRLTATRRLVGVRDHRPAMRSAPSSGASRVRLGHCRKRNG